MMWWNIQQCISCWKSHGAPLIRQDGGIRFSCFLFSITVLPIVGTSILSSAVSALAASITNNCPKKTKYVMWIKWKLCNLTLSIVLWAWVIGIKPNQIFSSHTRICLRSFHHLYFTPWTEFLTSFYFIDVSFISVPECGLRTWKLSQYLDPGKIFSYTTSFS